MKCILKIITVLSIFLFFAPTFSKAAFIVTTENSTIEKAENKTTIETNDLSDLKIFKHQNFATKLLQKYYLRNLSKEFINLYPSENSRHIPVTNTNALVGFIFGITSFIFPPFAIPGLILSIIGLNQIKKTKQEGNGMAIAGIILSSIVVLILLLYILIILAFTGI